jgi:tRNA pseudouridine55 synthase
MITKVKETSPAFANKTLSYAGRLDPMAEGLLLILEGDENKERKTYEDLKKTYEFTILCGIETDTYDTLGIVTKNYDLRTKNKHMNLLEIVLQRRIRLWRRNSKLEILHMFSDLLGKHMQSYPPYSSKTVHGKPLYWWARENRLDEIIIPKRNIEIYQLELLSESSITAKELRSLIHERVALVKGNFRQTEILHSWNDFFTNQPDNRIFLLLNCKVTCSSGTYIRSICHEVGKQIGGGAIALTIKRTHIGPYSLQGAVEL